MKRIKLRLLSLFFISASLVQADGLSFKILNNVIKEVKAGTSVNLMTQFDNQGNQERAVEVRLRADGDGWRLLTDMSSVTLPKLQKKSQGYRNIHP